MSRGLEQLRATFDRDPELYDRARPGYPAALFDDLDALLPGKRLLEIGCGTGQATRVLAERGYGMKAGLEIEFYVTKMLDPKLAPDECGYPPDPPQVAAISHGFQYLTDNHADEIDGIMGILRDHTEALGLPLTTIEDEWGPGQCEFTFDVMDALVSMPLVIASVVLSDIARMHLPRRVTFSIVCTPTISAAAIAITISWFFVRSSGPMLCACEIGILKNRTWASMPPRKIAAAIQTTPLSQNDAPNVTPTAARTRRSRRAPSRSRPITTYASSRTTDMAMIRCVCVR